MNRQNNWISWLPIVILFLVPYTWPIALFLLWRKLSNAGNRARRASSRHPYDIQREQQARQQAAGQGAPQAGAAWGAPPPPTGQGGRPSRAGVVKGQPLFPNGKRMTIAGGIVTAVFGLGFLSEFFDALSWGGLSYMLSDLATLLGFTGLGVLLLWFGLSRTRKGRRYRKYLTLIGRRDTVPIQTLAKVAGVGRRKLMDDLQDMLDDGFLPTGYLDFERDLLVLSEDGIPVDTPEEEPEPAEEAAQDDDAILLEIRQVNDAIPNPVMSAKIDRIGEITGRILDYQRQNPEKSGQLRSFLGYYLPTTLKILRAYAQLEAQGVEGENISAAKARIEGMMDKVVEGFEKQLDKLFQDSAMDISSDVAVLERMLEKDGLSGQNQGMTL